MPSATISTSSAAEAGSNSTKPLSVGIFGGSFNPIHLGHALLAITTQQTKDVDHVVLVPVYKHAVKQDLLPFDDRVKMCQLAIENFVGIAGRAKISVSTIEKDVGASNGAMIRGLKQHYPPDTKFLWICGDDFFRWMHRPKGLETLQEVSGLIVQRRLHRSENVNDNFYKEPINEGRVREIALKLNLTIDYIYGELPHFSSTLVRRAPGHWKSFLTSSVAKYLDDRPHLLKQLIENLEADAKQEEQERCQQQDQQQQRSFKRQRSLSSTESLGLASVAILQGLEAVHCLQYERGYTGLRLSIGSSQEAKLRESQANTDILVQEILKEHSKFEKSIDTHLMNEFHEVKALASELQRIPIWLEYDRSVLGTKCNELSTLRGEYGWKQRLMIVEKFDPRIDVLIGCIIRALTEILEISSSNNSQSISNTDGKIPELLLKWCEAKEALGRQRAFIACSSGECNVPLLIRQSFYLRERFNQTINTKERCMTRVLDMEAGLSSSQQQQQGVVAAPETLHKLLEKVTLLEYTLMGCFATTTPLPLIHKLLLENKSESNIDNGQQQQSSFDVVTFFEASTAAIDFLLSFAKALAASACASA